MIAGTHNVGHGWVVPRQDGARVRCGGPGLCMACQAEAMMLRATEQAAQRTPTQPHQGRGDVT